MRLFNKYALLMTLLPMTCFAAQSYSSNQPNQQEKVGQGHYNTNVARRGGGEEGNRGHHGEEGNRNRQWNAHPQARRNVNDRNDANRWEEQRLRDARVNPYYGQGAYGYGYPDQPVYVMPNGNQTSTQYYPPQTSTQYYPPQTSTQYYPQTPSSTTQTSTTTTYSTP